VRAGGDADPGQQLLGARTCLRLGQTQDSDGTLHDILKRRHVREQVELLEHHPHLAPQRDEIRAAAVDLAAEHHDAAVGRGLEHVEAAQHRRFARPARPQHDEHLPGGDVEIDAVQDLVVAERLVQAAHLDRVVLTGFRCTETARNRCRGGRFRHRSPSACATT
jgi:hypothetical protein